MNPQTRGFLVNAGILAKKGREAMVMTNAQRIRNMTDEELAKFLSDFSARKICEYYNKEFDRCDSIPLCVKAYAEAIIGDWMKQPVEE